jgi:hypothetical protein
VFVRVHAERAPHDPLPPQHRQDDGVQAEHLVGAVTEVMGEEVATSRAL